MLWDIFMRLNRKKSLQRSSKTKSFSCPERPTFAMVVDCLLWCFPTCLKIS